MTPGSLHLSAEFRQLYCDAAVFDSFSRFHPISFRRVLPFDEHDQVLDRRDLIEAEEAHLTERNTRTRLGVVNVYGSFGLLTEEEAMNLNSVIDFYDRDFFELMGLVHANAGMFKCALRWYRELILELETQCPNTRFDDESVYASVGYCLFSLGLFEETIAWSKSCLGARLLEDVVCQSLIAYESQPLGGVLQVTARAGNRVRYTSSTTNALNEASRTAQLNAVMKDFAPFTEVYLDWAIAETPAPQAQPSGYPFRAEFDAGTMPRHKMNLICATCCQTDALVAKVTLRKRNGC